MIGTVTDASGLRDQFLERGNLRAQLVEFGGDGEFVRQLVALGLVEVVLVLLCSLHNAALELSQTASALGGRERFEFFQQAGLLGLAALERLEDGGGGAGEAAL